VHDDDTGAANESQFCCFMTGTAQNILTLSHSVYAVANACFFKKTTLTTPFISTTEKLYLWMRKMPLQGIAEHQKLIAPFGRCLISIPV